MVPRCCLGGVSVLPRCCLGGVSVLSQRRCLDDGTERSQSYASDERGERGGGLNLEATEKWAS